MEDEAPKTMDVTKNLYDSEGVAQEVVVVVVVPRRLRMDSWDARKDWRDPGYRGGLEGRVVPPGLRAKWSLKAVDNAEELPLEQRVEALAHKATAAAPNLGLRVSTAVTAGP